MRRCSGFGQPAELPVKRLMLAAAPALVAIGLAAPAHAETVLGDIGLEMMDRWCNLPEHNPDGHLNNAATHNANSPYSWTCRNGVGLNMNEVCDHTFGSPAWSKPSKPGRPANAYTWYCWR
jgi:hypothetical protein